MRFAGIWRKRSASLSRLRPLRVRAEAKSSEAALPKSWGTVARARLKGVIAFTSRRTEAVRCETQFAGLRHAQSYTLAQLMTLQAKGNGLWLKKQRAGTPGLGS